MATGFAPDVAEFVQLNREIGLATPLGSEALLLIGFFGQEEISRLFSFQAEVLGSNERPVAFEALLGKKISAWIRVKNDEERYFTGICNSIVETGRDDRFTNYTLHMVPELWLLTKRINSRIFQGETVPEILKKMLKDIDHTADGIQGHYEPRNYCVQYRESDFAFISRLMEEEGIYYYFKHEKNRHVMVLADSPSGHASMPILSRLEFQSSSNDLIEGDRVFSWSRRQVLRSGSSTLRDHTFEQPKNDLEAKDTIQATVKVGTKSMPLKVANNDKLERFDYPGSYAHHFDGIDRSGGVNPGEIDKIFTDKDRVVKLRMQEEAARGLEISGQSRYRQLTAGHRFDFTEHHDADGPYIAVMVGHYIRLEGNYLSGAGDWSYSNHFTVLPADLPFRAESSTTKPFVHGPQTAVVVGPAGDEIFTDKYGRVKVQFRWDREGRFNEQSSCWVRVATPWAGTQWGMIHIPRIGQEVIVAFEEGDPDQPIIVGSVYNADHMPPYVLPDNKTQSGVKSRSSLNGTPANFNEIRFEDKKGQELVYVHAEKDYTQMVENDRKEEIGRDRFLKVGRDKTEEVGRDKTIRVKNNEKTVIDGNRNENVHKDETILIDGNRSETVKKDEKIIVEQNRSVNIGKDETLSVGGNRASSIAKDDNLTVSKNWNVGVSQNAATQVNKNYTIKVNQSMLIEAEKDVTIRCGQATITMKRDGKIVIEGSSLSIKGSGNITIKGQKVAIN